MPATLRRLLDDLLRHLSTAPGAGISFRQLAALALFWAVGSLALLLFRPGYGFPPFELLDSWIYTSYQWDLKSQIADFGPTYYGSRLSWILPGALLHSLLPPVAAQICFKLIFSALFAVGCGAIVHRAAGLPTTLLAVTVSLFAPQFIGALHADYTDTPVIVYAALALACITAARNSRHWVAWIFLGGCCFAGMTVANLSSLGTPGLGIAVFHLLWLRWGFKRQLACVGLYLLAATTVFLVIAGFHVRLGGPFYFLKPQVDMMLYFHGLKTNPWTAANWLWLHGATWLVMPVCTLLWGARCSVAKPAAGGGEIRRLIQALTAGLLVSLAWALMLEIKGVGVLVYYYYASFHLCFALPLLAALCWAKTDPAQKSPAWTGLLPLALILFSFAGKPLLGWTSLVPLHKLVRTPESMPLLGAGLLLFLGLLAAVGVLPGIIRRFFRPEIMVLGLIACSTSTRFHGHEISDRLRERYVLVHTAYRTLARELPRGSYIFWINADERNGVSLGSTKLWGYRMLTMLPFPELEPTRFTDRTVVVPCAPNRGAAALAAATKVLADLRIDLINPRVFSVPGEAGLGFDLACFSMRKQPFDPANPPSGMKPAVMLMAFLAGGNSPYTSTIGWLRHDPSKGDMLDLSRGYPLFTPTDHRDHMATQYHASIQPGRERHLSVVTIMPAAGDVVCTVQDENFRHILRVTLTKAGREVHSATLPPESTKLRVVFECLQAPATPLPTEIQIYEVPAQP